MTSYNCATFTDPYLQSTPYVVFCGNLDDLTCCHVLYEKECYNFTDCIEAIDFLFKLFLVLKVSYPHMTAHLWAYFQHDVFGMGKVRRTVGSTPIEEFLTELRRFAT